MEQFTFDDSQDQLEYEVQEGEYEVLTNRKYTLDEEWN